MKILKITDLATGREVYVNPGQIVTLEQKGEMVQVELSTGRTLQVGDEIEDVLIAAFMEKKNAD